MQGIADFINDGSEGTFTADFLFYSQANCRAVPTCTNDEPTILCPAAIYSQSCYMPALITGFIETWPFVCDIGIRQAS